MQATKPPEDEEVTAFVDLIQRDPTVCNNCFQRTHDATVVELSHRAFPMLYHVWDARRDRTERAHHEILTRGLTRTCDCGSMSNGNKRRPIPFDRTLEYADNLVDTLTEKGISIDADRLRAEVRERKRDPNTQGREDTDVFDPAVTAAIASTETQT